MAGYCAIQPPSTGRAAPRICAAASEHWNTLNTPLGCREFMGRLLFRQQFGFGLIDAQAKRDWLAQRLREAPFVRNLLPLLVPAQH
jgi:hypothetical protein